MRGGQERGSTPSTIRESRITSVVAAVGLCEVHVGGDDKFDDVGIWST